MVKYVNLTKNLQGLSDKEKYFLYEKQNKETQLQYISFSIPTKDVFDSLKPLQTDPFTSNTSTGHVFTFISVYKSMQFLPKLVSTYCSQNSDSIRDNYGVYNVFTNSFLMIRARGDMTQAQYNRLYYGNILNYVVGLVFVKNPNRFAP